ncbi:MAG: hypothetical protein AB1345_08085 [Chloroflexota bacterium]
MIFLLSLDWSTLGKKTNIIADIGDTNLCLFDERTVERATKKAPGCSVGIEDELEVIVCYSKGHSGGLILWGMGGRGGDMRHGVYFT